MTFQDGLVADGIARRIRALPTNSTIDESLRTAEIAAVPRRLLFAVWCTYSTADEHMERWLAGVWEDEAEAEAAAERARRGSDPYGRGPDQYGPTAVVRAIPLNTSGAWPIVKADKS